MYTVFFRLRQLRWKWLKDRREMFCEGSGFLVVCLCPCSGTDSQGRYLIFGLFDLSRGLPE